MGKLGKLCFLIISITLLSGCGVKTWHHDLPNNYQIRKTKDLKVQVGYVENNKFYLDYNDKKVGVDEYTAEFQTSDNYVGLKCVKEETLEVIYYIIDTKNQNVYGPYSDLDTYLEVIVKITDNEVFNNFKSVVDFDK